MKNTVTRRFPFWTPSGRLQLTITVNWPQLARYLGPRTYRNLRRTASVLDGAVTSTLRRKP